MDEIKIEETITEEVVPEVPAQEAEPVETDPEVDVPVTASEPVETVSSEATGTE